LGTGSLTQIESRKKRNEIRQFSESQRGILDVRGQTHHSASAVSDKELLQFGRPGDQAALTFALSPEKKNDRSLKS